MITNRLLFGDMPSGEVFHVSADQLPNGGQDAIRRVLFVTSAGAAPRTALEIIQEKNASKERRPRRARTCDSTSLPQDRSSCSTKLMGRFESSSANLRQNLPAV